MSPISNIITSSIFYFCFVMGLLIPVNGTSQIFSEAARTEFFQGLGIRVFYGRINKTRLNKDEVFINSVPLGIVYGVQPKLSVIGIFPVIHRTFERSVNKRRISDTDSGLGDITIFLKYRFYKKNAFLMSREFAIQFGLKLPSGADNLKDGDGNRFPRPLQIGTGALDYRSVLTFTDTRNRIFFTGDLAYDLKTEANGFEFGDVLKYDLTAKYRIYPINYTQKYPSNDFFILLELNGRIIQKSKSDGIRITDTGAHQIFLSPGIQYFPLENILVETGIQLPVLQDLNGTQLSTDFNIRAGIRWIISF